MQPYGSFKELKENEVQGKDYCIHFREGTTGILVMAPHAGDIEPATGELADAIAGSEHSLKYLLDCAGSFLRVQPEQS